MPLVVVMTSVLPRQTSGVKSPGELPRSNPGIGNPCARRPAGPCPAASPRRPPAPRRSRRRGSPPRSRRPGPEPSPSWRGARRPRPPRRRGDSPAGSSSAADGQTPWAGRSELISADVVTQALHRVSWARRLWHKHGNLGRHPLPRTGDDPESARSGPPVRLQRRPRQGPRRHLATLRLPGPGDFLYPSTLPSRRPPGRATRAMRPARRARRGPPVLSSSRCMDARAERAISSARRTAAIHRRPGAFRPSDSLGAGEPDVRRDRAGRPAGAALRRGPRGHACS